MTIYRMTVKSLSMVREFDTRAHAEAWADDNIPFEYGVEVDGVESDGFYKVCSYCGLITEEIPKDKAPAMAALGVHYSHGACKDCVKRVLGE